MYWTGSKFPLLYVDLRTRSGVGIGSRSTLNVMPTELGRVKLDVHVGNVFGYSTVTLLPNVCFLRWSLITPLKSPPCTKELLLLLTLTVSKRPDLGCQQPPDELVNSIQLYIAHVMCAA